MKATELVETCIRQSRDPQLIADTHGNVVLANDALYQLLDASPADTLTLRGLGPVDLQAHLQRAATGNADAPACGIPARQDFHDELALPEGALPVRILSQPLELDDPPSGLRLIALQPQRRRPRNPVHHDATIPAPATGDDFQSADAACRAPLAFARRAATSDVRMMLLGESGTGKTRLARAIHRASRRAKAPFVEINCAAIPEELLESELFGHARGAFSGAVSERIGRFEAADGGTLFLDEIGEMSPRLQAKLLRAVQDGAFERVGENTTREVDVRILAASNRDLREQAEQGQFRTDLYYRLAVATVELPPLRQRPKDLAAALDAFCERQQLIIGDALRARLLQHPWPGNFRELENVCECLALHARAGRVDDFPLPDPASFAEATLDTRSHGAAAAHSNGNGAGNGAHGNGKGHNGESHPGEGFAEEPEEARRLRAALAAHAGNRSRAARALGINRSTLWRKLHRYHLV
ncbi:MAG: sigma 54-interacting transcriptional regulator, partial [Pseudomonadota bacterium]